MATLQPIRPSADRPVPNAPRRPSRLRRRLLSIATALTALGWLLFPLSWFVHVSDTEFTESQNWTPSYQVVAQLHHLWSVGNGFVFLMNPAQAIPAASPQLDYPDHFAQTRRAGTRYRLTLIRYASSEGKPGVARPPLAYAHEFGVESPDAKPYLLGAVRFAPEFETQDLWRWELDRRNGSTVAVPLWALLLVPTLALTPLWISGARKRSRIRRGCCPDCGYDRAGLAPAAACPECGRQSPTR